MKHFDLIVDICTNAELTRDQKAQIVKILMETDDGWIAWNGGDCPVGRGARVSVKFRSGIENHGAFAGSWHWWHQEAKADIIAYRVIKE